MKHLFTLNHYFVKYKWHFILGILFVTGSNYYAILIPQKVREALDLVQSKILEYKTLDGSAQSNFYDELSHSLMIFGLIVTGFVIIKGILMYFMRQTIIVMSRLIEKDMRNEIYGHIQKLDQSFYRSTQTGDIMARISEDVSKVRNYLGPGILYGINLVTLFVITIYAMLQVDLVLTIFALLPLPILSISIYYVSSLINKKSTAIQTQLSVLTSTAQEIYSGIRVVKAYTKEEEFTDMFDQQCEEYRQRSLSLSMVESYFQPLMILLISISTLLVVIVGGYRVFDGHLTTGNIAEFILYVNMLTWPVTAIGWIASVVQEAEASQKRINELLNTEPVIVNSNNNTYDLKGDIEFQNVSFTYPNTGIEAIKNVSFKLNSGDKMAILGKTGSGKTTIMELLTRMFEPTEGKIILDGKDLKDHNLSVLRDKIGSVTQDVFLFSETIESNISFGSDQKETVEIQKYAAYASIDEEIKKLPEDYTTMVGERGVTLSGGQKQRISIARAFIKQPSIVILDDALSAVDTSTEQNILKYFENSLKDKTAIIITHRANNFLNYDKIIVLDQGQIVEEGTHDQLVSAQGFYAYIYGQQMNLTEEVG